MERGETQDAGGEFLPPVEGEALPLVVVEDRDGDAAEQRPEETGHRCVELRLIADTQGGPEALLNVGERHNHRRVQQRPRWALCHFCLRIWDLGKRRGGKCGKCRKLRNPPPLEKWTICFC